MASRLRLRVVLPLAVFCVLPSIALAQTPTAADKDTARSLMTQGNDLRAKGDLKGALSSFQAADAIMHVPSTGIEVAKTEAALGLLVEARDAALAVSRTAPQPNEPKPFVEARKQAQDLAADLEPRIPTLQITVKHVPPGSTPAVEVDGVAIPAAAVGFPRKVNPGHHVIVATAGEAHAQAEADVVERESKGVLLDLPEIAATPTGPTPVEGPKPQPGHDEAPKKKFPVLAVVGFGVGIAGVAVGSVTGLMSISKTSSLKDQCPNDQCPASVYDSDQFQSDKSTASTLGTISTISFIVGGVGIAVGVVGLVLPRGQASAHATTGSAERTKPFLSPWISPAPGGGAGGLVGSF